MEWLNLIANSAVLQALAQTLVHFAWQGSLLAIILFLLLRNIPSRRAQLRYNVSLFTLVLCVATPLATFGVLYAPETAIKSIDMEQVVIGVSGTVVQFGAALTDSGLQSVSFATAELLDFFNIQLVHGALPFLALTWIVGVLLLSTRVTLQMVGVSQLPRQATYLPEPQLQQLFERLLCKLEVSPVTRLLISDKVDVPMAIGWLKPVVLLPSSMVLGLTPGQLEMLLMHELAHVRRHDYIINFFQTLVELLLFFHPAVRWISSQIRMERECCCDDIAVAHVGNPVAYAATLTEAEMSRFTNIPGLAMAASGSDLKSRILRVVGHVDCADGNARLRKSGLVAALCCVSLVMLILVTGNPGEQHSPMIQPKVQNEARSLVAETSKSDSALVGNTQSALDSQSSVLESESQLIVSGGSEFNDETAIGQRIDSDDSIDDDAVELAHSAREMEAASGFSQTTNSQVATNSDATLSATVDFESTDRVEQSADKANEEIMAAQPVSTQRPDKPDLLPDADLATDLASASVEQVASVEEDSNPEPKTVATQTAGDSATQRQAETITIASAKKPEQEITTRLISPVLLDGEAPVYPRQALRRGLTDRVQVSFKVNTLGKVEDIAFRGSVHRSFKKSVRRALSQWQFKPGLKNGEEIAMTMQHVFSFAEPENAVLATTGTRIDAK